MSSLRTIDPTLPPNSDSNIKATATTNNSDYSLPEAPLPLPYTILPNHVHNLSECARHILDTLNSELLSPEINNNNNNDDIENALDDGFFICDLNVIQNKVAAWRNMFPRIKPFFALKCNPDVMVAAVLGRFHDEVGYDCASIAEIKLALSSSNGNVRRCVYANPQRGNEALAEALALNVQALTFDSMEELHKIKRAHELLQSTSTTPLPAPETIVRLLVPDATSSVPLGEKFGAPPNRINALTMEVIKLELPIVGVSFHCGSGCHDPDAYTQAIRLANDAMKEINQVLKEHHDGVVEECKLLDIGGGYPGVDGNGGDDGRFCGVPSSSFSKAKDEDLRDSQQEEEGKRVEKQQKGEQDEEELTTKMIANVVTPLIDELFPQDKSTTSSTNKVQIISEPGRYFVEQAFALCSRIYSTHVDENDDGGNEKRRHYYIAQGLQGVFKDVLLCEETFVPIPLQINNEDNNGNDNKINDQPQQPFYPSTVHGPSGEDFDLVCADCRLPNLKIGDWLLFDRMGAYTLSIAARSGSLPIRYVVGGGGDGGEQEAVNRLLCPRG